MKLKSFIGVVSVLIIIGGLFTLSNDSDIHFSDAKVLAEPCKEPLTYRIEDIDSRYNITAKELSDIMKEVEELWSTALGRDLLEYSEDGKVGIQLIYSEEQKRTEEERKLSNRIKAKGDQIEIIQKEYQRFVENYKKKEKELKSTIITFNQVAESYNELAKEWDGQELSDNQIAKLKEMEREIKNIESEINRKQDNLESLRKQTNAKSEQLNNNIEEQNRMIDTYNERFGGSTKFDQGQFVKEGNSETIKIYQFSNQSQLKTVLAHEVGHALGLGHVSNPESIMYHIMGKQNIFDLTLTDEDITAIKERCKNF